MLILSRKVGETIEIGSDVTLTVTRIAGGRIQIGIDAPREVPIRRGEVAHLMQSLQHSAYRGSVTRPSPIG